MKMPTNSLSISLSDYPIPSTEGLEVQVLADATNNPELFQDYRTVVSGECFENEVNRAVWERLTEHQATGEDISFLTLRGIAPQQLINDVLGKTVSTPMQGLSNCRTLAKVHNDREVYKLCMELLVKASNHDLSMDDVSIIDKLRSSLESTTSVNYRRWEVDITQAQAEPDILIERGGKVFLSRSNLCVLVGRPKAGKTTVMSAIAAAAVTGKDCLGFSSKGNYQIVWFDTEQARDDSLTAWQCVYKLADLPIEKRKDLVFYNLRATPLKERLADISSYVRDNHPDIVIIDGLADLLYNPNDIEESRKLVDEIIRMNTAHDCGILAILHVNWRDEKARGHLGTEVQAKAENITLLAHTAGMDSSIKVTPQLTRKAPYDEFSFSFDENKSPVLVAMKDTIPSAVLTLLDGIVSGRFYKHKELISIMTQKGVGESNAKKYIGEAVRKGYLHKYNEGYVLEDGDLPE